MARRLHLTVVAVAVIAAIAAALRLNGYATAGSPNADEYDWAWSGLTLIVNHVPTGWTDLVSAYPVQLDWWWQGNEYNLVTPYLDHPPLFSLLVGGFSWLLGARQLTDVSLGVIRLIPIALSIGVLVLTFRLARELLGSAVAFATIALLAISPVAIDLARVTESEALLTIWILIALLAVSRRPTRLTTIVLFACCLLGPLTKLPGVFVGAAVAGILVYRRDYDRAVLAGLATIIGVAGFIVYGGFFDATLFADVWSADVQRHTSWLGGYDLLRGAVADRLWIVGLAGLLILVVRNRAAAMMLVWPAAAYILVIAASSRPSNAFEFSWYRIPIEPFVYLGAAFVIVQVFRLAMRLAAKKKDLHERDLYQAALPGITADL